MNSYEWPTQADNAFIYDLYRKIGFQMFIIENQFLSFWLSKNINL